MTLLLAMLQTEGTGTFAETLSGNPIFALSALFGAGILTSLNPCIYPMIPITASILSGTARSGGGRGRTVGFKLAARDAENEVGPERPYVGRLLIQHVDRPVRTHLDAPNVPEDEAGRTPFVFSMNIPGRLEAASAA